MKTNTSKSIFIFISVILTILIAILTVPSIVANNYSSKDTWNVIEVPEEYYSGIGSTISSHMSHNLSDFEKIRLISGVWNSSLSEGLIPRSTEYLLAVNLAKSSLKELYDSTFYPYEITESELYTWDAVKYTRTDETFKTFSADYWIITLTRYDGNCSHKVLMTDSGVILYAEYSGFYPDSHVVSFNNNYSKAPIVNDQDCSYIPFVAPTLVPAYSEIKHPNYYKEVGILTIGSSEINNMYALDNLTDSVSSYEHFYLFRTFERDLENDTLRYVVGMYPYEKKISK